ncbi:hypothetical protein AB0H00_21830 [Nocardia sp. NPDC023852]|uniref:hypothetical protein n=1 Tax=Nocardia sp. NPDC023852 TaxID=3154697 RepID=UPI0033F9C8ED
MTFAAPFCSFEPDLTHRTVPHRRAARAELSEVRGAHIRARPQQRTESPPRVRVCLAVDHGEGDYISVLLAADELIRAAYFCWVDDLDIDIGWERKPKTVEKAPARQPGTYGLGKSGVLNEVVG